MNLLRQIEMAVANGKTTSLSCKEAEITEQTYYRWRKEYGGLQVDQARRLKELESENAKLKRLVSELSLEKLVLKAAPDPGHRTVGRHCDRSFDRQRRSLLLALSSGKESNDNPTVARS